MTARAQALPWFENDGPRELARWSLAAAVVVGVHVALIGGYMLWQPATEDVGDDTEAIAIELTVQDIDQQEQAKVDQPPPPPETTPDVTLPEEKPPEKVETAPVPRTSVKSVAAAPRINPSWLTLLMKQLQRFQNYPSGARARSEQGVVRLSFAVDREGHVVSQQITTSSGYPDLDAEALAMLKRAQPLPAFPASMTQEQQNFDVPIRFTLH